MNHFPSQIFVLLLISLLQYESEGSEPDTDDNTWVININSGPVEGIEKTTFGDLKVQVYYGIPYAEPPIGPLRFQPPQPVKKWTGVLKATKKTLPCYQQLRKASAFRTQYEYDRISRPWTEDCLTLNVWVPKPKVKDTPVVVLFHPGMFEYGSNNDLDASVFAVTARDIVVSMNYRLGAFGFLNLGNSDIKGNMGLLDQQLALKWIHENIKHFGGLERAMIILGAGDAGAASAGYHVLSPGSVEYIASISPFSGAPTCSWAFQMPEESIQNSKLLSKALGCYNMTTDEEHDCLIRAHPEDIVDVLNSELRSIQILPTVDGTFITEAPLNALKSGHFKKVVALTVSNVNQGALILQFLNDDFMPDPEQELGLEEFRKAVRRIFPTLSETGMSAVEHVYIDECDSGDKLKLRHAAVKIYSDVLIDCCMNSFEEFFVLNGGKVFRCVEDIRKESNPSWVGAWHTASLHYTMGYPLVDDNYSELEKNMTVMWMDEVFKLTRKKASALGDFLVPYEDASKNYTFWNSEGPQYFSKHREDQCRLWNEIIPKLSHGKKTCDL